MTFKVGDKVRMTTGFLGAGRVGTVIGARGDVLTVEFTAPVLIFDPAGRQEIKRLPYAAHEVVHAPEGRES